MTEPDGRTDDHRWPRSVYRVGDEPDPRFTLANERTFLAWVRTALAFVAAGVALTAYDDVVGGNSVSATVGSLLLIACGMVSAVGALLNWMRNERALRTSRPLPSSPLLLVLTGTLVVFAAAAVLLAL